MDLSELPIDVIGPPADSVAVCEPPRVVSPELERAVRIAKVGFDYSQQLSRVELACNLCGSAELEYLERQDRYGFDVGLSCCKSCGLVFINPSMTPDAYADFYAGTYRNLIAAHSGVAQEPGLLEAQQAAYAGNLLTMLAPHLAGRAGQEYLDIGGSTGVIAGALKGAFALGRTIVLDPCEEELAGVKKRGCIPMHCTAEGLDTNRGAGSFGVITLLQTIDHLLDPAKVLATVEVLLSNTGVFVLDIVNFQTMLQRYGLAASVKIDHPYNFTAETIETYLARAHFLIVESFETEDQRHIFYVCCKGGDQHAAMTEKGYAAAMLKQLTEAS